MARPTIIPIEPPKQKWEQLMKKHATKRIKSGDKKGIQANLVLNRVRSQQVIRNLSFWYRERWGA